MMKTLHKAILLLTVIWSVALLPEQAFAQTASLTCTAGAPDPGTEFFYTAPNAPGSACEFGSGGQQHIFSGIICQFISLLNSVLASVYCGMQDMLQTMVGAVLTIFVAVFGAKMLMGSVDLSAREFITRLLKIAFVCIFITQSTWAVQYAFQFFVLLAGEGVEWVMSSIPSPWTADPCVDPMAASATGFMAAFTRLDVIICKAITGPFTTSNSKVIGFFLVLSALAPQIGVLVLSWLLLNLKILVHGLVTFLLGIAAIAFLIAMSPIFLCMMLFKATVSFFENWVKFMVSFSLQIIIVFAVAALWLSVMLQFLEFFNDLSNTIFPDQTIITESSANTASDSWGICPFTYFASAPPPHPPGPYVECNTGWTDVIPISSLIWPTDTQALTGGPSPNGYVQYLYYMIYHLITLIVVSFAFDALLREAPMIAVYLAGPDYVSPLAGGMGVNRAGQVRSLFASASSSSSGSSGSSFFSRGGGSTNASSNSGPSWRNRIFGEPAPSAAASAERGGSSAAAAIRRDAPPPPIARATIAQRAREQSSSMVTKRSGNDPDVA